VTDESQVATAVDVAAARFGSIDVLANNAGRGLLGAVEEATAAEVGTLFATNVFRLLNVTRAVLPRMRAAAARDRPPRDRRDLRARAAELRRVRRRPLVVSPA